MTFSAGTKVITDNDRRENPWAACGTVLFPAQEIGFTWVQWPENDFPAKEEDWTLIAKEMPRRAPDPDEADLAAERAGF